MHVNLLYFEVKNIFPTYHPQKLTKPNKNRFLGAKYREHRI